MPRLRAVACDVHVDGDCQCYKRPVAVVQSLEELDYLKSACAAAQQGNLAKLGKILDRHPHAVNTDGTEGGSGYTPLHYAARGGHVDVAKLLLSKGADPNRTTRAGGATALHRACYMGHSRMAQLLVRSGASASIPDSDGLTALHKAAQQGHVELLQYLQASCPEAVTHKSNKGLTADEMLLSHLNS
ncbi:hypothetical protein ABBQ32_005422 [Trebouxia sp. C0010 RCD-2024]